MHRPGGIRAIGGDGQEGRGARRDAARRDRRMLHRPDRRAAAAGSCAVGSGKRVRGPVGRRPGGKRRIPRHHDDGHEAEDRIAGRRRISHRRHGQGIGHDRPPARHDAVRHHHGRRRRRRSAAGCAERRGGPFVQPHRRGRVHVHERHGAARIRRIRRRARSGRVQRPGRQGMRIAGPADHRRRRGSEPRRAHHRHRRHHGERRPGLRPRGRGLEPAQMRHCGQRPELGTHRILAGHRARRRGALRFAEGHRGRQRREDLREWGRGTRPLRSRHDPPRGAHRHRSQRR